MKIPLTSGESALEFVEGTIWFTRNGKRIRELDAGEQEFVRCTCNYLADVLRADANIGEASGPVSTKPLPLATLDQFRVSLNTGGD